MVVSRADAAHEDPAIGAFLTLLEADIRAGRNVGALPQGLGQTLLANAGNSVDLDDDIEGEVTL